MYIKRRYQDNVVGPQKKVNEIKPSKETSVLAKARLGDVTRYSNHRSSESEEAQNKDISD